MPRIKSKSQSKKSAAQFGRDLATGGCSPAFGIQPADACSATVRLKKTTPTQRAGAVVQRSDPDSYGFTVTVTAGLWLELLLLVWLSSPL